MERFADRRVLITGAGSGIGRATVHRILSEGGTVVAADVNEAGLAETAKQAAEQGSADRLTTVTIDISDESSVQAGVAKAVETLGGLDALVNAAGILRSAHTHEMPLADWNRIITTNLTGTFLMIREALPALLDSGRGVIVNFASTSTYFAHPYMAAYAASKGGIMSMTHALASEYSKQNLRAVAVAPGSISSDMTDGRGPGLPEDADFTLFTKLMPMLGQGFASPDTVAGVVAMLASDDGAFITGTEVRIDGGTHA
ncbi:SDR family NAD(P)-dependent oxidoreductase [Nocardia africana]|uniref:Pyridoxal 4-dehydrogenase n=1 Tax=Nocardia africana TaxID=134964 RepID=A0A378WLS1_9NOCA|nr:SDR family oxidoreductase [Nocardia africana]MCC3315482.1 SDR family oxidoreductase [Nocardia africana]SUA42206.1 Pyridoxal 4-dehydrogenase [Nocardia africana]